MKTPQQLGNSKRALTKGLEPRAVKGAMPPSPMLSPWTPATNTDLGSKRYDAAVTDAQSVDTCSKHGSRVKEVRCRRPR